MIAYGFLICHALLKPLGDLPLTEGIVRRGRWGVGRVLRGEEVGEEGGEAVIRM